MSENRCSDCPPRGYPTDKTRCLPCPYRNDPAPATNTQPPTQEAVARAICRVVYRKHVVPLVTEDVLNQYVDGNWRNHIDTADAAMALFSPPAGVVEALAVDAHELADDLEHGHYAMCDAVEMIRKLADALLARQALSALEGMGKQGLSSSRGPSSTSAATSPDGSDPIQVTP